MGNCVYIITYKETKSSEWKIWAVLEHEPEFSQIDRLREENDWEDIQSSHIKVYPRFHDAKFSPKSF